MTMTKSWLAPWVKSVIKSGKETPVRQLYVVSEGPPYNFDILIWKFVGYSICNAIFCKIMSNNGCTKIPALTICMCMKCKQFQPCHLFGYHSFGLATYLVIMSRSVTIRNIWQIPYMFNDFRFVVLWNQPQYSSGNEREKYVTLKDTLITWNCSWP